MLESGSMFLTPFFQQCSFPVLSGNQEPRGLAHHGFLKNLVQRSCYGQCYLKAEILTHKTWFYLSRHLCKNSIDFSIHFIISGIILLLIGKEQLTNNSTKIQV